jgi:glycosyltransferase involved in cell wall biosynthesis
MSGLSAVRRSGLNRGQSFLAKLWARVRQPQPDVSGSAGLWRIEGPFDSSYSLAIENREIALALSALGESVSLESRDGPGPFAPDPAFLQQNPMLAAMWERGCSGPEADVVLRNAYPPSVTGMPGAFRGLVCYAWEESGFPPDYVRDFNANLHLVTVISRFVAKVLRDNGVHVPIRVIGCGIDQIARLDSADAIRDAQQDARQKYQLGDAFCFLHVSTCLPRKAVDVLLEAWRRAFTRDDNVVLVIKGSPNHHHRIQDEVAALAAAHPEQARIVAINEQLSPADVHALYRAADVVVCASRGEGFGLPLAEALALGKPVIATAHGGQMDFCTPDNAWLCDYDFAYTTSHVSTPGSVWAEPRLESLVDCLRQARSTSPQERRRRGRHGRKRMQRAFVWRQVADNLRAAVMEVKRLDVTREPRIAWVSPWNTPSTIAEHSRALVSCIAPERLRILANRTAPPASPDEPYVTRCRDDDGAASVASLHEAIQAAAADAVVIQFDAGVFSVGALGALADRLTAEGKAVYIFLHSTTAGHAAGEPLSTIAKSLKRARRVFVSTVDGLNWLKRLGIVGNATLLPLGLPAIGGLAMPEPAAAISARLDALITGEFRNPQPDSAV